VRSFIPISRKYLFQNNFLQEKVVEATKYKEEKRKKPKPEEQEGMQKVEESTTKEK
jgi:hypothetical protein